jgi:hypothetical protein
LPKLKGKPKNEIKTSGGKAGGARVNSGVVIGASSGFLWLPPQDRLFFEALIRQGDEGQSG